MIFARHIGADKRFTQGRVYLATPEFDDSDEVSSRFIEIRSDTGEIVRLMASKDETSDGNCFPGFEFLPEVYAVVVKPTPGLDIGRVVVIDEVSTFSSKQQNVGDRMVYNLRGLGCRNSDLLALLDQTNVIPGIVILDVKSGKWVKIRSVDECLWVTTEDNPERRSPNEFRFAVDGDGDIMVEPLVECVYSAGSQALTKGNKYYIVRERMDGNQRMFVVVNDTG